MIAAFKVDAARGAGKSCVRGCCGWLMGHDGTAADGVVTRAPERAELKLWRTGISKQLLNPAGADGRLNLFLVHIAPGGSTGDELYTHEGEEAGLGAEGEMTLTVDADIWTLQTGDSFRFASRPPAPVRKSRR